MVEWETIKTLCNTKDELKARLTTFTNFNKEIIRKACKKFPSRLKAVVEMNGDFFEKI